MAEKCLKLILRDQNRAICIMFLLVLLLAEANPVPKEKHSKKNPVSPHSSSDSKIVFTLLTKIIVVYIRLSVIYIWKTGL